MEILTSRVLLRPADLVPGRPVWCCRSVTLGVTREPLVERLQVRMKGPAPAAAEADQGWRDRRPRIDRRAR